MGEFFRFMILGLGTGAMYALSAQGLVLVYRSSGTINFAHGAIGMVGAFVFYALRDSWQWPTLWCFVIGIACSVAIGVLVQLTIMRPLRRSSPLVRLVATLGVFAMLVAAANLIWGTDSGFVESPLPSTPRRLFGLPGAVGEDRLWLIPIAFGVTALLWLLFGRTQIGRATEAVAENPSAASALGISPDRIALLNWVIASAVAALTAILVAPILFLSAAALSFVVLRGMAAALVGGFRNFWLTLGGAFAIGVIEAELGRAFPSQPGIARSSAFLVIVVALVFTGRALPLRRDILDRLPTVGSGRVHPRAVIAAVAGMVVLLLLVPDKWTTAITISMTVAMIMLSLVVVTGYVGQVSLAQFAIGGFGAWTAGRLADNWSVPFPAAILAGVAAAVLFGLVVALPALRTRGVNLAVITFGLATMLYELVLNNPSLNGGLRGTQIGDPHLFGIDVNGVDHPIRYALVVLVFLTLSLLAVANLRRSAAGRRMLAVRANERAAASIGIDVYHAKLSGFAIGSAIASLGGILLAFRQSGVQYGNFDVFKSISALEFTVIGGIGYVIGPLFAAGMVPGGTGALLIDLFGWSPEWLALFGAGLLLLTLLTQPNGMAHHPVETFRAIEERRRQKRGATDAQFALPPAIEPARVQPISLIVEGLTVRFGGVVALSDVSLRVEPGQVVGLIGPNGAGKTTLIDAVTGFVRSSTGTVQLGDQRIESWPAQRRNRAGLARSFQSLELFEDLTVLEHLQTASDSHLRWSSITSLVHPRTGALSHAALAAIAQFDLGGVLHRKPHELPYAQRRLVGIARAIASSPSVLLLDEPAAGLSSVERNELGGLIVRLAKDWGFGVLLVEHDVVLVMGVCDTIVALDFGRQIAAGSPHDVAHDPAVVGAYLGTPVDDAPGPVALEVARARSV